MKGGENRGNAWPVRVTVLPKTAPDTAILTFGAWALPVAQALERTYPGGLAAWLTYHVADLLYHASRYQEEKQHGQTG